MKSFNRPKEQACSNSSNSKM